MLTRCPQCLAVHPLEADRGEGDDGSFVCPGCGNSFDAYAHLTDVADAHAELEEACAEEISDDESSEEQSCSVRDRSHGPHCCRVSRANACACRDLRNCTGGWSALDCCC